jgi:hypothetical protein
LEEWSRKQLNKKELTPRRWRGQGGKRRRTLRQQKGKAENFLP